MPDISAFELIALLVLAVVIFGPDRLPGIAADAGRFLRRVRQYVSGAKRDLRRELGPEFADIDLADLNPRRLVRRTLMDPDDYVRDLDLNLDLDLRGDKRRDGVPSPQRSTRPLGPGERPPFDPDAT